MKGAGHVHEWVDRRAVDPSGDVVGVVVDVYTEAATGRPRWLAISGGYFGTRIVVAPNEGAAPAGDDVRLAHRRALVETAPTVRAVAALTPGDEQILRDDYSRLRPGTTPAGRTTRP